MTVHLARRRTGIQPAMIAYTSGHCWSRGEIRELSHAIPDAPTTLRLPVATPAVVPGPAGS